MLDTWYYTAKLIILSFLLTNDSTVSVTRMYRNT